MLRRILPLFQRRVATRINSSYQLSTSAARCGIYEPDYLESLKPKFPQYECLNFQVRGYDFPVLESYQKWLHGVAEYLELDVSECYAIPPKHIQVQRFKPASTVVDSEYKLLMYERTIQVSNVDAPVYPLFLRIVQEGLPEGVTLEVVENLPEHEEVRYVPDKNLLELKAQLEDMHAGQKKK